MIILTKVLTYFVFTAIAGKLICAHHVFAKYNRIIQQASEYRHEAFSIASNITFPVF